MTTEEFRHLVNERSDTELLEPCFHEDVTPYVFEPNPPTWPVFRNELASQLGVAMADIKVVGSGRLGFSMKPGNGLREFSDTSDIDVVVIHSDLFDSLWLALLDAAYPRPPALQKLGGWLEARRNEVYTGWLTPLAIKLDIKIFGKKAQPVLDFNLRWFTALKGASKYPPRRHEDIRGRLYRTIKHAEIYHLNSLAALRKSLTGP